MCLYQVGLLKEWYFEMKASLYRLANYFSILRDNCYFIDVHFVKEIRVASLDERKNQ